MPRIIGAEGAGTVLRGAGEFAEGDRVAWAAADGSYAEQAAVPVAQAVTVPDGTSSELAAAAILQGMTAHYLCALDLPGAARATSRSCTPPPAASGCCSCR